MTVVSSYTTWPCIWHYRNWGVRKALTKFTIIFFSLICEKAMGDFFTHVVLHLRWPKAGLLFRWHIILLLKEVCKMASSFICNFEAETVDCCSCLQVSFPQAAAAHIPVDLSFECGIPLLDAAELCKADPLYGSRYSTAGRYIITNESSELFAETSILLIYISKGATVWSSKEIICFAR